jgi:hypothetical protein
MALDALQTIAVDFCTTTEAWAESIVEAVPAGDRAFPLPLAGGIHAMRIRGLWIDGSLLDRSLYWSEGNDVIFRDALPRDCAVSADVVLRPSRLGGETKLTESLAEEWGDVLAFGSLAKLKSMSGRSVEWSDIQGAQINNQLYIEGTARATAKIFRIRHGGGMLFSGGEYV